jgi:hypothetical protein
MQLLLVFLALMLLAPCAAAQTPRAPEALPDSAFYAESGGALPARLFGTVRVGADSVEVLVSEGSLARPWVSFIHRQEPYTRVTLRAYLAEMGMQDWARGERGDSVVMLPSLEAGAERPIGPLRFVLPRPAGPLDRLGLVFEVSFTEGSAADVNNQGVVFACGRYGAFAVAPALAASFRTCGRAGEAHAGPRSGPPSPTHTASSPVRSVCVEDPAFPGGMRPSDAIAERLAGDSALSRSGERRPLSEFRPRIVGYAAGAGGLEPPGTDVRNGGSDPGVQVLGARYVRFGMPRPIPHGLLIRIGEALGASVFVAAGSDVLDGPVAYVLLPDCTFQPYATSASMM